MKTTKLKLNLDLEDNASKKLRSGRTWNQFFEQMFMQLVNSDRDNEDALIASALDKDVYKSLEALAASKEMFFTDFLKDVYSKIDCEDDKRKKIKKK